MIWNRILNSDRSIRILHFLAIFVVIFAMYGKSYLMFLVGVLIGLSSFLSMYYIQKVSQKLFYANEKENVRLFPEDETMWNMTLTNYSKLPVFNSRVRVLVNNNIAFQNINPTDERKNANEYILPLSFFPGEEKNMTFEIKGLKRGVAKISNLEVHVADLLSLATLKMINDRLVQAEFIVYPTILPVSGVEDLIKFRQGVRPVQSSLYEDHTSVVGTRDYLPGDSFQRIHWKASARMEEMQTKLHEKTVSQSWTILLNVVMDSEEVAHVGESELLEKQISHTAFLCQYAVQHHIPFEIFVNIKTMGRLPFMHLEMGEGKSHLVKALELLARLNINSIRMPMFRVLTLFNRQQVDSTVVILVGDDKSDTAYYDQWLRQGIDLHKVYIDAHTAKLERYTARRSIS